MKYPTGALVKVLQQYKKDNDEETYNQAKEELKNLLFTLIQQEIEITKLKANKEK